MTDIGSTPAGVPLANASRYARRRIVVPGWTDQNRTGAIVHDVGPGYFGALGVPILSGREPAWNDQSEGFVGVVNETFVRTFLRGENPIGRDVQWSVLLAEGESSKLGRGDDQPSTARIIGVVRDFRQERPPEPIAPALYWFRSTDMASQTIVARTTAADPMSIVPAIRTIVSDLDPTLPTYLVERLDHVVARGLWRQRMQSEIVGIFAAVALLFAAVGVYGVISYVVAVRRREFGVRIALGATPAIVVRRVLRDHLQPVLAGLVLGLAAALGLSRVLDGLLYGVHATDPADVCQRHGRARRHCASGRMAAGPARGQRRSRHRATHRVAIRKTLMAWPFRRRRDQELDEEIRAHLDMDAHDRLESGATADEARAGARREFGNVALVKDATREIWGWTSAERLAQDVRYGVRLLRRSPGFTTVALLCLAVGVGATALVFSAINGLLLQALPYEAADRVVVVHTVNVKQDVPENGRVSWANFLSWRASSRAFGNLGVWNRGVVDVSVPGGDMITVAAAAVSPAVFPVMRLTPALGRAFVEADQQFGNHYRVILSDALWRRNFGADPGIIGRFVTVLSRPVPARPYEVIGVMPPGTGFPEDAELWLPLQVDADEAGQHAARRNTGAIGRLVATASIADARTEMTEISRRIAAAFPKEHDGWEVRVVSLRDELVGSLKTPVLLFQGAAVLLLFIACANVANLLLARGAARRREMAVRGALGAGQLRLARQLFTESLLLAFAGGALGVVFAVAGLQALPALLPEGVPHFVTLSINRPVLAFALLVSAGTGLLFGLLPALRTAGVAPREVLHEGSRYATWSGFRTWARQSLVIAEIAMSLVLVIGATLLVRSNLRIEDELGYERRGAIAVLVPTPADRYEGAPREAFFEALAARVRALPGVVAVGRSAAGAPLAMAGPFRRMSVELSSAAATSSGTVGDSPLAYEVTPNYFDVMGVPLIRGRSFLPEDRPAGMDAPQFAVVVNETFARAHWPTGDPLGKQFTSRLPGAESSGLKRFTIVGVARNFRMERPPRPIAPAVFIYAPLGQNNTALIIRTSRAQNVELVGAITAIVRELDPALRIAAVQPFETNFDRALWREHAHEHVLALFGGLALGLSVIGLYGVIAYTVARRTREFGVRLALGATRTQIFGNVVSQGLGLATIGIVIGVAAALSLTQLLSGLLYGIRPTDPLTFSAAALLLGVLAVLAGTIPAVRATTVDPVTTLRAE